ncbi:MAG: hypothetical protein K9M45_12825 [Kiritimatiellales bacterium]|nr:hypothetical protein [Kiritimatiellales bacterium]
MLWIGTVVVVFIVLYILGSIGSMGRKQIREFSDSYDLLFKMKPTPWSHAKSMTSEQRAQCLFMPNIEDVDLIKTARGYIRSSMGGDVVSQRAAYGQKIGTNDHAASFDDAFNFYHWLLCCVFHKLKDGPHFRQSDYDLYAKKFSKSFCPPAVMIKTHKLEMPKSLRL